MADGFSKDGGDGGLGEWREFIDQIAHDLASPISFLEQYINRFSATRDEYASGDYDMAEAAKRSFGKIRDLVGELRSFVREAEIRPACSDFAAVARNSIAETMPLALAHGINFSYDGPAHLVGLFDERKVGRALINLIINSIEAIEGGLGRVNVRLSHDRESVWIEVKDSGKGIPERDLQRIFDRGFTSGKAGGTGLGLAYCRRIAGAHGGSIEAYSRDGGGAVFSMMIPRAAAMKVESSDGDSPGDVIILGEDSGACIGWFDALREAGAAGSCIVDRESFTLRLDARDITFDPID